jgi:hypothetical protein
VQEQHIHIAAGSKRIRSNRCYTRGAQKSERKTRKLSCVEEKQHRMRWKSIFDSNKGSSCCGGQSNKSYKFCRFGNREKAEGSMIVRGLAWRKLQIVGSEKHQSWKRSVTNFNKTKVSQGIRKFTVKHHTSIADSSGRQSHRFGFDLFDYQWDPLRKSANTETVKYFFSSNHIQNAEISEAGHVRHCSK